MKVLWRMRKRMTTTTTIMVINKLLAHQNEFTERIHREVQMRHHSHGKWHQKPNENRKRVSSRLNFPDEDRMSTEVTSQNRCFLRKDGLPAVKPARCIDLIRVSIKDKEMAYNYGMLSGNNTDNLIRESKADNRKNATDTRNKVLWGMSLGTQKTTAIC